MTVTERQIDRDRLAHIGAREEEAYRGRSPRSAELYERARQALPLGVASSFQAYDPYPLFMTDARGARIWDADGNEYIDFDMAFGVLAAGHSHPLLAEALQRRVANGTCYTFPVESGVALAEEIKARFGADAIRFSNSGTEATMDAVRVARGYTGREKIIKFEGGYHGHHDDVLHSIQPPRDQMGGAQAPATVPASAGIPSSFRKAAAIADSSKADPGASSTTAVMASPNFSSGMPTATASRTDGWVLRTSSTSSGKTFSPPVLMQTDPRPRTLSVPSPPVLS